MCQEHENPVELKDVTLAQEERVISLLLEEYRTLRAETVQAIGGQLQIPSFFIAGVALLISLSSISNRSLLANPGLYLSFMVLVGAYIVQRRNRWHYVRIGEHLAALEQEINERARRVYGSSVSPLTWEMKQKNIREAPRNALARWRYRAIG